MHTPPYLQILKYKNTSPLARLSITRAWCVMCASDGTRSRAWCFTWNNYPDDAVDRLKAIQCERMVVAHEVGELGTPHLQGYVRFKNPQRFSYWKIHWPQVHVGMRKGTETQAAEYCYKDGKILIDVGVNFDEKIDTKGMTRNSEMAMVIDEAEKGASYGQIRKRHMVFCAWNRSKVMDVVNDARYYKVHEVDDDAPYRYEDVYKNTQTPV